MGLGKNHIKRPEGPQFMKSVLSVLAAAMLSVATSAAAESPVVVELYTSQGCSSCPPADAIFAELAQRDDVIALALHVDYWDYIGWKDEFAVPAFADRQRGYAAAAHRRSIYTPQMVVNGQTDIVGARPMELSEAIAKHAAMPSPVTLDLTRQGDALNISAQNAGAAGNMVVQLVRYTPMSNTRITRGENAGMTLDYANVARDWQVLGTWDGRSDLSLDVPVTGDAPLVVLVQQGTDGPILAADALR